MRGSEGESGSADDDGREEAGLKTALWLEGYLRHHSLTGGTYYIAHRGDRNSGTVALKLTRPPAAGCRILTEARTASGEKGWMPALRGAWVEESEGDAYLTRLVDRDPDVWVVEVETRDGHHPFPGPEIAG